ncbi:MAG: hypothetical protein L0Z48_01425 [candidate division Zixibacteria bacterium]|nr:hypothetical protein [candidate division Zixibacteria bacterium]MCI0595184.1 hypothetical protein [candidate division Zixibacteria bacterium]
MRILTALALLLFSSVAFSQPPDPRDSIILESKTVTPGAHPGPSTDTAAYLYIRVLITNKDSLTYLTLPILKTSTSGGAYATVAHPRNFLGVVSPLTNTLRYYDDVSFVAYNSSSPDKFGVAAGFDPADPATIEPPNAARKAIWELKFDSVWAAAGTFELDSTTIGSLSVLFANAVPQDVKVNFVKDIITVPPVPKGDLNWDLALTAADVVLALNCIFCSDCPPPAAGVSACDLNCDGMRTPADVVLELYAVFLSRPFPC